MNNKIIAAIVVVLVIGGVYFLTQNKSTDQLAGDSKSAETQTEMSTKTASIKSLIDSGSNQKCTYQSKEGTEQSSGTFYITEGKMRGDISVDVENTKTTNHMVYDGAYSYIWSDDSNAGFKMALDSQANTQDKTQSTAVDTNKDYNFSCEKWSVDNSKFELPGNVQFADFGAMTGVNADALKASAGAAGSTDTKALQQATCNSLPEPAKTSCMNAL